MIARPKISRNERKTTEIGAFEVGNFAPLSCPGRCPAGRLPLKANTQWTLDGAPVAVPDKAPKGLAIFDVKDTCFVVVPAAPAGDRTLGITVTNAGGYAGLSHLIHY